ncbi:FmdB family zinc ribbon protein [Dactylosporangium sp. CS-047395]|uniref:FmdB family zinc ribbon protein n=1 Tax=Dactylosporangium sp. CS-047395 TaxID=3239936 RepID=UPI003D943BCD
MPTYQYACTVCGHQLEAVQSFTDEALTECPECQGRLRKQFSAVGVVFKGSGFYRTDSRSNGKSGSSSSKSESTKTETKSESSAGTKTETKSDSKPAASTSSSSSNSSSSSSSSTS